MITFKTNIYLSGYRLGLLKHKISLVAPLLKKATNFDKASPLTVDAGRTSTIEPVLLVFAQPRQGQSWMASEAQFLKEETFTCLS